MTSNLNIFSALGKYNSAIDENYLTESFIFVINSLLSNNPSDRSIGCEFLTYICTKDNEFMFAESDDLSVSTQECTDQGTPDIKVFCPPDKLVFIEVKHDSPLGETQISRYKQALDQSEAKIKKVVLLTRFAVDFKHDSEKPYKHIHWYEIYNWLSSKLSHIKDPVNLYLIQAFNSFLEAKKMSVQKITWEYINGMPAMLNMANMIEVAIESSGVPQYKGSPRVAALEWRGYYLGSSEILCCIVFNDPLNLHIQLVDKQKFDKSKVPSPSYPVREDKKSMWISLSLEQIYFFSLDKDKQLALITNFVKTGYQEAIQMRKPKDVSHSIAI